MMLKVICAGLPRTGTTSLAEALRILGYNTLHHAPERLPLFPDEDTNFRVYDDVDAVADLPAAMYWYELLRAYPEVQVILTVRDAGEWYESMCRHVTIMRATGDEKVTEYSDRLHTLVFGSAEPSEYWYKKRFQDHNWRVVIEANAWEATGCLYEKGLALDVSSADAWQTLCGFLNKPIPDVPFPHLNKGANDGS